MPQHLADCPSFNGVTRLRAGAVRFHVGDARFREFLAVNPGHQRRLRLPVRKGNPGSAAVRIHGRRPNHRVNGIPVLLRLSKRLQQHHRPAFTADVPIRLFVKDAAGAGFREHPGLRKADEPHGGQKNVHAPRDRGRDFAVCHRPARHVQCHQRRRTGRVHREGRPMKIKGVGNAVRNDGKLRPRHRVDVRRRQIVRVQHPHVGACRSHVDRSVGARKARRRNACVFKSFPRHRERHPLLRIKRLCFFFGEPPERGVKGAHVAYDPRPRGIGHAGRSRILMPVTRDVKTFRRERTQTIPPVGQRFPERLQ